MGGVRLARRKWAGEVVEGSEERMASASAMELVASQKDMLGRNCGIPGLGAGTAMVGATEGACGRD